MTITLFVRTYPVKDAPFTLSLVPFPPTQKATIIRDGKEYDAVSRETRVTVPDGSVVDAEKKVLCWRGDKGTVRSTARQVYELVLADAPGFGQA
jgi:hypothetical protein